MADEHRYLRRIAFLLNKLEVTLRERGRELELTLLGVEHTGHIFPGEVPALVQADLVSLELPSTPVKAYLAPKPGDKSIHIRNTFWLDVLEHCRRIPPPLGVYGCNVNPHVRYLRARLYYRHGMVANDFEAPALAVSYPSESAFTRDEWGGAGSDLVSAETVFAALSSTLKVTFARNGIVHVSAQENPLGPGRHLILYAEPPTGILELETYAIDCLAALAKDVQLDPKELPGFVQQHLMEGFLMAAGDFYLVELLLEKLIRAAGAPNAGAMMRAVHVAGIAHLPHLSSYLSIAPGDRFRVLCTEDPRYPIHNAYLTPPFFARELKESLAAVSLHNEEVRIDPERSQALIDRYRTQEADDLRRRLLVEALWTFDTEPKEVAPFRSLVGETPLDPSPEYAGRFSAALDRHALKHLIAAQPLSLLTELNTRLARNARRGNLATITQELRELGLGYEHSLAHPEVGPLLRLREEFWHPTLTRAELHALIRRAHRRCAVGSSSSLLTGL